MSLQRPHGPGPGATHWCVLGACLLLVAAACSQEAPDAVEPPAVVERPTWKPPAPPPRPKSCGVGCLEGKGNAVVRFQMEGGEYTASITVEGNEGQFAIGPPLNISRSGANWSGIETFFNPEPGVYPLKIRATGKWTLSISKGKQSYVDG